MIDWILVLPILLVAAWIWLALEVWDAVKLITSYLILNPWASITCIGMGALTVLMERAAARRKAGR